MDNNNKKPERRTRVVIKSKFEKKILRLVVISLASSLVISMGTFYTGLRIKIHQAGFSGYTEERLSEVFSWLNWFLPVVSLVLIFLAGMWAKHLAAQVAGPLYALEKQVDLVAKNRVDKVMLRRKDEEMLSLAAKINRLINERIKKREDHGHQDEQS